MKLAFTVVYLVAEHDEPLLDIHLSQIEKCTNATYTIYAAVNRLLPKFRAKIESNPRIRICDYPTTGLRDKEEHSYYQEQLIATAIADGATHVCTLHVDSFPVRHGWIWELKAKLSEKCVLASIMHDPINDRKPLTACLFFSRDFYLQYRPTLLLTKKEMESPEFQRYCKEWPNVGDSGVGYGFKLYQKKLTWFPLLRSSKVTDSFCFGCVYSDMVYHLLGTARYATQTVWQPVEAASELKVAKYFNSLRRLAKSVLPKMVRRPARKVFGGQIYKRITMPMLQAARAELYANPEVYLSRLTGKDRDDNVRTVNRAGST